jgi:hypothetical protein
MTHKCISVSEHSAFHVSLYIGSGCRHPGAANARHRRSDSLIVGWERSTEIGNTDGRGTCTCPVFTYRIVSYSQTRSREMVGSSIDDRLVVLYGRPRMGNY